MANRTRTLPTTALAMAVCWGAASGQSSLNLWNLDHGPGPQIFNHSDGCAVFSSCPAPLPPVILQGNGGIAQSNCDGSIWVTAGNVLANIDTTCSTVLSSCTLPPPSLTALDVDDVGGVLYWANAFLSIGTAPNSCPFTPTVSCTIPPPLITALSGMDYDPFTGTVWVVDLLGTVANLALGAGTCTVLSSFSVACPTGPLPGFYEGIAYDACAGLLHIGNEDGNIITMTTAGAPVSCCMLPGYISTVSGLAHQPLPPIPSGSGCMGPACPPCSPVMGSTGDPVAGSSCFALTLSGGPTGGAALLALNATPGPVPVPILCAPLEVGLVPSPVFFGPFSVGGTGTCNGTLSVPLPIPLNAGLCGLTLYTQWLLPCATPPHGVSNGLAITIQSY